MRQPNFVMLAVLVLAVFDTVLAGEFVWCMMTDPSFTVIEERATHSAVDTATQIAFFLVAHAITFWAVLIQKEKQA